MASLAKLSRSNSPDEKRLMFESSVKESFADFREMCLNFRSTKYKPDFEEEALRSPKKDIRKVSSFELKIKKVGGQIKVADSLPGFLRQGPESHQRERQEVHLVHIR